MTRLREPMDDARFDGLVAAALRRHADDLSSRQPAADVALERLGLRLATAQPARATVLDGLVPGRFRDNRAASIAWLALLLTGLVAAALIGAQLLRQERQPIVVVPDSPAPEASGRPLIVAPPFGFGATCTILLDPDVLLEVESSLGDQTSTLSYGRPGYVTERATGSFMGFDEAPRTRMLTDEAIGLVEDRIAEELDLAPGCYTLRTSEAGGLLTVRTAQGLVQVAWSQTAGDTYLARQMPVDESERLRLLAGELAVPHMWLPESAFSDVRTREWEAHPPRWLVHTILNPTEFGSMRSPSTGISRADAIVLPGGADLADFGTPIAFPALGHPDATQRCASITQDEAIALATSLDSTVLGIDTSLFTTDGALEIFLSLIPAGKSYDCRAFEADLRADGSAFPVRPPPVTGDLAFVDPCNLAPDAIKGRVDLTGYEIPVLALGVSARRCVLVNHESFGVASQRVQLWLYPSTLTPAEAEVVVSGVFGDGAAATTIDGHPAWLNHCLDGGACVGAIAAWVDGRLLVLEVLDTTGTPTSRVERARSDMAAIIAMAE